MATRTVQNDRSAGSDARSHGVRVTVTPAYRPEHSATAEGRFVFTYAITITNESDRRVRLLSRRWRIIDADGEERVVEGDGVIGEQPTIEPGTSYSYSSWCPLPTRWGTMEGSYTMIAEPPGESIRVRVARFYLVAPDADD